MRATILVAAVVGIIGSAVAVGLSQSTPTTLPIKGVWQRTSTVVTGANPSRIENWSPEPLHLHRQALHARL
jgi:hypothetical protein